MQCGISGIKDLQERWPLRSSHDGVRGHRAGSNFCCKGHPVLCRLVGDDSGHTGQPGTIKCGKSKLKEILPRHPLCESRLSGCPRLHYRKSVHRSHRDEARGLYARPISPPRLQTEDGLVARRPGLVIQLRMTSSAPSLPRSQAALGYRFSRLCAYRAGTGTSAVSYLACRR